MKLYYSPGACSLASHIVLFDIGVPFDIEKVDIRAKKTASGADYATINPKGYVPTLKLNSGDVLTENAVILQYLADQKPGLKLAPSSGSMERYRLQEWLNFTATEIHKGYSPLWNDSVSDEMKNMIKERLAGRFEYLNGHFSKNKFLMGDHYTVADAYLFTVFRWSKHLKVDLSKFDHILSYISRVADRPSVQSALKAEGLSK